jgi:hypothetical protein
MADSGRWDLQPHAWNGHGMVKVDIAGNSGHFFSNKKWLGNRLETDFEYRARIAKDMAIAKTDMEKTFNTKAVSFAFPFGDYGDGSKDYPEAEKVVLDVASSLYPIGFYQTSAGNHDICNYPGEYQFLTRRVSVRPYWTGDNLLAILQAGEDKNLPFTDNFSNYEGWIRRFGETEIKNNSLALKSFNGEGSSIFLAGSKLWDSYVENVDVSLNKGNAVFLVKYKDDSNYASVVVTDSSARIEQKLHGKTQVLDETKYERRPSVFNSVFDMKLMVSRGRIAAFIDGVKLIESANTNTLLDKGSIGFEFWSPDSTSGNENEMVIRNIRVQSLDDKY